MGLEAEASDAEVVRAVLAAGKEGDGSPRGLSRIWYTDGGLPSGPSCRAFLASWLRHEEGGRPCQVTLQRKCACARALPQLRDGTL